MGRHTLYLSALRLFTAREKGSVVSGSRGVRGAEEYGSGVGLVARAGGAERRPVAARQRGTIDGERSSRQSRENGYQAPRVSENPFLWIPLGLQLRTLSTPAATRRPQSFL